MSHLRIPNRSQSTTGIIPSGLASTLNAGIQASTFLSASILDDLLNVCAPQQNDNPRCPHCNNIFLISPHNLRPSHQDESNIQNIYPQPRSRWNRLGTSGAYRQRSPYSGQPNQYSGLNIPRALPIWSPEQKANFGCICPYHTPEASSAGDSIPAEYPVSKSRLQFQFGQLDPIIESNQEHEDESDPEPCKSRGRKKRISKKKVKKLKANPDSSKIASCGNKKLNDINSLLLNSENENIGLETATFTVARSESTGKRKKLNNLFKPAEDGNRASCECNGECASPTQPTSTSPVRTKKKKKKKNIQRKGGGETVEYISPERNCSLKYPKKPTRTLQPGTKQHTIGDVSKSLKVNTEGRGKKRCSNRNTNVEECNTIILEQKPIYGGCYCKGINESELSTRSQLFLTPTSQILPEPDCVCDGPCTLFNEGNKKEYNIGIKNGKRNKRRAKTFKKATQPSNKVIKTNSVQCETEDSDIPQTKDKCNTESKSCGTQYSEQFDLTKKDQSNRCFQTCHPDCPSLRRSSTHSLRSRSQVLEPIAEESVTLGSSKCCDTSCLGEGIANSTACDSNCGTEEKSTDTIGECNSQRMLCHEVEGRVSSENDARSTDSFKPSASNPIVTGTSHYPEQNLRYCARDTILSRNIAEYVSNQGGINHSETDGCICSGDINISCRCGDNMKGEESRENINIVQADTQPISNKTRVHELRGNGNDCLQTTCETRGNSCPYTSHSTKEIYPTTNTERTENRRHESRTRSDTPNNDNSPDHRYPCCIKLEPIDHNTSETSQDTKFNVVRIKCADSCPNKKQSSGIISPRKSPTVDRFQLNTSHIKRGNSLNENYMNRRGSREPNDSSLPQNKITDKREGLSLKEYAIISKQQEFGRVGNYLNGVINEKPNNCIPNSCMVDKTGLSVLKDQQHWPSSILRICEGTSPKDSLEITRKSEEIVKGIKDVRSEKNCIECSEKESRNKIPLEQAISEIVRHTRKIKMQEREDCVSLHKLRSLSSQNELATKKSLCMECKSLDEISYELTLEDTGEKDTSTRERDTELCTDGIVKESKLDSVAVHSESCLLDYKAHKLTKSKKEKRGNVISHQDSRSCGDTHPTKEPEDSCRDTHPTKESEDISFPLKTGRLQKHFFNDLTENNILRRSSVDGEGVEPVDVKSSGRGTKNAGNSKIIHKKETRLPGSSSGVSKTHQPSGSHNSHKTNNDQRNIFSREKVADKQEPSRGDNSEQKTKEYNGSNIMALSRNYGFEENKSISTIEKENFVEACSHSQNTSTTDQYYTAQSEEEHGAHIQKQRAKEDVHIRNKAQNLNLRNEVQREVKNDHRDNSKHKNNFKKPGTNSKLPIGDIKISEDRHGTLKLGIREDQRGKLAKTDSREKDGKKLANKTHSPPIKLPISLIQKLKPSCRCCTRCMVNKSASRRSFPEEQRQAKRKVTGRESPEKPTSRLDSQRSNIINSDSLLRKRRTEEKLDNRYRPSTQSKGDDSTGVARTLTKGPNDSEIEKWVSSINERQNSENLSENIGTLPGFFIGESTAIEQLTTTTEVGNQKYENISKYDSHSKVQELTSNFRGSSTNQDNDYMNKLDSTRPVKALSCNSEPVEQKYINPKVNKIVGSPTMVTRGKDVSSLTANKLSPHCLPLQLNARPTSYKYNPAISFEKNLENLRQYRNIVGISESPNQGNASPIMRPIMRPISVSSCSTVLSLSGVKLVTTRANDIELGETHPTSDEFINNPVSTHLTKSTSVTENISSVCKLYPIHETLDVSCNQEKVSNLHTCEIVKQPYEMYSQNRLSLTCGRKDVSVHLFSNSSNNEAKTNDLTKGDVKECVSHQLPNKTNEENQVVQGTEKQQSSGIKEIEITSDNDVFIKRCGDLKDITPELSSVEEIQSQEVYTRKRSEVSVNTLSIEEDTLNKFDKKQQNQILTREDSGHRRSVSDISCQTNVSNVRRKRIMGKSNSRNSKTIDERLKHDCTICEPNSKCSSNYFSVSHSQFGSLPGMQENLSVVPPLQSPCRPTKLPNVTNCNNNRISEDKMQFRFNKEADRKRHLSSSSSSDIPEMTSRTSSSSNAFRHQPDRERVRRHTKSKSRHGNIWRYPPGGRRRLRKKTVTIKRIQTLSAGSQLGQSVLRPVMQPVSASSTSTILSCSGVTFQINDQEKKTRETPHNTCDCCRRRIDKALNKIPDGLPEKCCHGIHVSNQYAARYHVEHITDEVYYSYPRSEQIPIQKKPQERKKESSKSTGDTLNYQVATENNNKLHSGEVHQTNFLRGTTNETQCTGCNDVLQQSYNSQVCPNVREECVQFAQIQENRNSVASLMQNVTDDDANLSDSLPGQLCKAISKVIYQALCKPDTYMTLKTAMSAFSPDIVHNTQTYGEKFSKHFDDRFTKPERDVGTLIKGHNQYNGQENSNSSYIQGNNPVSVNTNKPEPTVCSPIKLNKQEPLSGCVTRIHDYPKSRGRKVSWNELINNTSPLKATEIKKKTIQAMPGVREKIMADGHDSLENAGTLTAGTRMEHGEHLPDSSKVCAIPPTHPPMECIEKSLVATRGCHSQKSLDSTQPQPILENEILRTIIPFNILGKTVKLSRSPIVQVNNPPQESKQGRETRKSDTQPIAGTLKNDSNSQNAHASTVQQTPAIEENKWKKRERQPMDSRRQTLSSNWKSISENNSRAIPSKYAPPSQDITHQVTPVHRNPCYEDGSSRVQKIFENAPTNMKTGTTKESKDVSSHIDSGIEIKVTSRVDYKKDDAKKYKNMEESYDSSRCARMNQDRTPINPNFFASDSNFAVPNVISDREVSPGIAPCNSTIPMAEFSKQKFSGESVYRLLQ